ncbi:MAG: hypothetical protein KatS3mg051_0561 [Anaerolineae bacterium]|nr:MAG: hypothetical protein KatS3mg051_0561 [Anaerolineae bacterium]
MAQEGYTAEAQSTQRGRQRQRSSASLSALSVLSAAQPSPRTSQQECLPDDYAPAVFGPPNAAGYDPSILTMEAWRSRSTSAASAAGSFQCPSKSR